MKTLETKGFTLIEVLVVLAIFGVLAAMVISQLLRARLATNEASAIGSLRAINTAQENYSQKCHGYAPVLTELKLAGNYLSPDLTGAASVSKSGYILTVVVASTGTPVPTAPAGCTATTSSYYATATPLGVGYVRPARLRDQRGQHDLLRRHWCPAHRSVPSGRHPDSLIGWRPVPTDETQRRGSWSICNLNSTICNLTASERRV